MCQFFFKQAGVAIDEDKFKTSVENNPHGWGLLYRDVNDKEKGKWIYMECKNPKKDTDPDELYKIVNEDLKDKEVLVHMRWVTAGDRSKENIHPHLVYEDEDGNRLWLVHNGTLQSFVDSNSSKSDTVNYINNRLKPVAELLKNPCDLDAWLELSDWLDEDMGTFSRMILVSDINEYVLLLNSSKMTIEYIDEDKKNKGFKWIAANDYSFRKGYRFSTQYGSRSAISYSSYGYNNILSRNEVELDVFYVERYTDSNTKEANKKKNKIEKAWKKKGYTNFRWVIRYNYRNGNYGIHLYGEKKEEEEEKNSNVVDVEFKEVKSDDKNEDVNNKKRKSKNESLSRPSYTFKFYFPKAYNLGYQSIDDLLSAITYEDLIETLIKQEGTDEYIIDICQGLALYINDSLMGDEVPF